MTLELHSTLTDIAPASWDALFSADFPFGEHAFLLALEQTGCLGAELGWTPLYLTAREGRNLVGALALYAKGHSYGEYIFDWGWAQAYQAHGLRYYPKLVSQIPFTPATGPRVGVASGADAAEVTATLVAGARSLMTQTNSSSLHFLFSPRSEAERLAGHGGILRHSYQFHWTNHGYRDFADFLDHLKARKAKTIRHERTELGQSGVRLETLTGESLRPEHAQAMFGFYQSTTEKMGAVAYLTPEFFERIFVVQRDRVWCVLASFESDPGRYIAGALHFRKGDALYGRYWGATHEVRHLHFELCYYQAIELAIRERIGRVEAGAQGEHKLARGFLPSLTYSVHWLRRPDMHAAIDRWVCGEREGVVAEMRELAAHSPFRNDAPASRESGLDHGP